jgi:hypothetical protein
VVIVALNIVIITNIQKDVYAKHKKIIMINALEINYILHYEIAAKKMLNLYKQTHANAKG